MLSQLRVCHVLIVYSLSIEANRVKHVNIQSNEKISKERCLGLKHVQQVEFLTPERQKPNYEITS